MTHRQHDNRTSAAGTVHNPPTSHVPKQSVLAGGDCVARKQFTANHPIYTSCAIQRYLGMFLNISLSLSHSGSSITGDDQCLHVQLLSIMNINNTVHPKDTQFPQQKHSHTHQQNPTNFETSEGKTTTTKNTAKLI